ncbi:MAG: SPOR domain-containing protein [Bacteroidetes bacterium]|nr:SPOR domain-containing protein [Bacteroidota bacterium]
MKKEMSVIQHGGRAVMLFVFLWTGIPGLLPGQDSTSTAPAHYTVYQSESIGDLVSRYKSFNQKREGVDGYRVQISYTDVREDAYKGKAAMYREFPDLKSYVEYEQPYYKLRVGDFKTRLEATYYLQQIIALYPGAFIVKDKVKLN